MRTVSICDTQPVTAEGIRTLLSDCPDLKFEQATDSLSRAMEMLRESPPSVVVVDKAFGIQTILEWLTELRTADRPSTRTGIVIWGVSVTEAEALRFLQAARAASCERPRPFPCWWLACRRGRGANLDGRLRFPRFGAPSGIRAQVSRARTAGAGAGRTRIQNKDIAVDLGIRPGTVKIHLKHIFEKTGVRGRYGLALSGLKERGLMSAPA
jgi:DNA-binding NarL/FixJ family response regulator